eukprot:6046155-Prymnesium_polylepis.4
MAGRRERGACCLVCGRRCARTSEEAGRFDRSLCVVVPAGKKRHVACTRGLLGRGAAGATCACGLRPWARGVQGGVSVDSVRTVGGSRGGPMAAQPFVPLAAVAWSSRAGMACPMRHPCTCSAVRSPHRQHTAHQHRADVDRIRNDSAGGAAAARAGALSLRAGLPFGFRPSAVRVRLFPFSRPLRTSCYTSYELYSSGSAVTATHLHAGNAVQLSAVTGIPHSYDSDRQSTRLVRPATPYDSNRQHPRQLVS